MFNFNETFNKKTINNFSDADKELFTTNACAMVANCQCVPIVDCVTFGFDGHLSGRVLTVVYCLLLNINRRQLKISNHQLQWHMFSSISELSFDYIEILGKCYKWLQKRIQAHQLGFNLLPYKFSLREHQNLYKAY
ncbi:MAG: hypothetical protein H7068_02615 [Pedobacter sp.]|nr:hypothetical protein [Chitinophagaceae bacterium]